MRTSQVVTQLGTTLVQTRLAAEFCGIWCISTSMIATDMQCGQIAFNACGAA